MFILCFQDMTNFWSKNAHVWWHHSLESCKIV